MGEDLYWSSGRFVDGERLLEGTLIRKGDRGLLSDGAGQEGRFNSSASTALAN